jgi:nucleoside phosphorylase
MPSITPDAIAVILTALDSEFQEVFRHIRPLGVVTHPSGTHYHLGSFYAERTHWIIALAANEKHNVYTAILTERAINYFDPDAIIFVGCAGGRDGSKIGDVVAASRIHDYESGAETNEGFKGADQGNTVSYKTGQLLKQLDASWKTRVLIAEDAPNKETQQKFLRDGVLRFEPIASGEKTQKANNSSGLTQTGNASRDAAAVETEGHGFLTAAHMNSHGCAIILRGISDKIIDKSNATDIWSQPFSVACAAAVAFEFLSKKKPDKKFRENRAPGLNDIFRRLRGSFSVETCPFGEASYNPISLDFGAYADAGFFAEAVAAKISSRNPEEMDKSVLCEVATLCQKAGYIDMAWRFIYEGLLDNGASSPAIKAHTYLVALKLFSQQANEDGARWIVTHHIEVIKWLLCTNDKGKIPSVYSRTGVAYALIGESEQSADCFREAIRYAEEHSNTHQLITIGVLWAMATCFRDVEPQTEAADPIDTVVKAQMEYLEAPVSLAFAQAYPLKSAVQSLFAEAAMLLRGSRPEKGRLRLAVAGVMRRKAFAHPQAEGFAELIALVRAENTQELLRFTMDPSLDISRRQEIQPYIDKCSELATLFSFGIEQWKELRKLLEEDDVASVKRV